MITFEYDSILDRMKNRLSLKLDDTDMLFFSTNLRVLEAVAEEMQEQMRYNEFTTRESKWNYARQISSLLAQNEFFSYRPHRKIGGVGQLRISASSTFDGDHSVTIPISKYAEFSNGEISFINIEDRVLSPGQNYIDLNIRQGIPKTKTFEITSAGFPAGTEYVELEIDNANIDNALYDLKVNGLLWAEIDNIRLAEDEDDQIYVIRNKPDFSGIIIQFGNDVFGKKLELNDIVTFQYIETQGAEGNILQANNVTTVIDSYTDANSQIVSLYCKNIEPIVGGSDYEDIESIRANAPRAYQTGDRAMTKSDYQTIILSSGQADRVIVWGETEINQDRGNPPGTYLPTEENLVYISGFNVDPITLSGTTLTEGQQTILRETLNELKGPTDIIRFVDTQFIYINFHTLVYVSDRRYSLEEVRANVENGLRDKYSLDNTEFRENLYFSQYYEYINSVQGVNHHETELSFTNLLRFESAYSFYLDIGINNIKPETVKIYVRHLSGSWTLIAQDDGNTNLIGEPIDPYDYASGYYNLPEATINYADGFGGDIIVSFGLNENYTEYDIKVDFELIEETEGHLLLTKRQQILSYYSSSIVTTAMDTY